jgi:hypothetical protein
MQHALSGITQQSQRLPHLIGVTRRRPERRLIGFIACTSDRQQAEEPLTGTFNLRRRCVRSNFEHEEWIASPVRKRITLTHRILSPDP